jgi:hypothetical protein
MATAMRLEWSGANGAWVFTFGDSPLRIRDESMFYPARSQAVAVAKRYGMRVLKSGAVVGHDLCPNGRAACDCH